ncbi:hypothetical protein KFK09_018604 [Dendrobium nobile]|uniref:Uncharacterized protein n=1 Tax=Dendrobium nobile TaxID=94219 RepID=A0A8T3AXI4_DENNO|nr:hypothetical protein KFK09_018604 [Dendrobium nobile]
MIFPQVVQILSDYLGFLHSIIVSRQDLEKLFCAETGHITPSGDQLECIRSVVTSLGTEHRDDMAHSDWSPDDDIRRQQRIINQTFYTGKYI